METTRINIEATVLATPEKVWNYYTQPEHITQWNAAGDDWHCPRAENNLRVGGKYLARMEAKDGSMGFDFEAVYDHVEKMKSFTYTITDGRKVIVKFEKNPQGVLVTTEFEAENQNPIEMQQQGWQGILNNFKQYVESH